MNFFKGMGQGGSGGKKPSLFGGMKLKGAKDQKNKSIKKMETQPKVQQVYEKQKNQEQTSEVQQEIQVKVERQKSQTSQNIEDVKINTSTNQKQIDQEVQTASMQMMPQTVSHKQDSKTQNTCQNDDKKYSASQACHQFEKKRDRKKSNPFLNQIKKNPRKQTVNLEDQKNQPSSVVNTGPSPQKKIKKSEKEQLLQELNQAHIRMIEFVLSQKQVKQAIIQIASGLGEMKEELNSTIQLQFSAVQKQEYEEAEKFQNKIDNLQAKVQQLQVQMDVLQKKFYKQQYDHLNALKQQGNQHKKMIRKIKLVEMQLTDESSNLKRSLAELVENQQIKIENQNKKIIRLGNDIKFQIQQLNNLQKQYKEDLDSRKDPLLSQLQESTEKKVVLEKQIQELQAILKKKKNQLKDVNESLKEIKKQINQVEETFKQQGNKLKQRKNKVNKLQTQKTHLQSHLQELQNNLDKQQKTYQNQSKKLIKQAQSLQQLAKKIQDGSIHFEDKMQEKRVKVDTFLHNTKTLKEFQEQHKSTKQKIKQLQFKKANISAQTNKYEERRVSLKNLVPRLESEQKSLAAAKNFKGAGMKKTEIKEAVEQIELMTKKIENCFIEQKIVQQEIEVIEKQQQKYFDEENDIRKNLAISQFRFNLQKYAEIKQQLKWLSEVQSLKLKTEDKQKWQQSLKQELESLQQQIKYIGEEYQLQVNLQSEQKNNQTNIATQQNKQKNQDQHIQQQQYKQDKDIQQKQISKEHNQGPNNDNTINNDINNEQQKQMIKSQQQRAQQSEDNDKHHEEEVENDNEEDVGYVPLQLD